MIETRPLYPRLTARLIRRGRMLLRHEAPVRARIIPGWRQDLRLFAGAWAMGFVFFFAWLA